MLKCLSISQKVKQFYTAQFKFPIVSMDIGRTLDNGNMSSGQDFIIFYGLIFYTVFKITFNNFALLLRKAAKKVLLLKGLCAKFR